MAENFQFYLSLLEPDIEALAGKLGDEFQSALTSSERLGMSIYRDLALYIYEEGMDLTSEELKLELVKATKFSLIAAETFKSTKAEVEE